MKRSRKSIQTGSMITNDGCVFDDFSAMIAKARLTFANMLSAYGGI